MLSRKKQAKNSEESKLPRPSPGRKIRIKFKSNQGYKMLYILKIKESKEELECRMLWKYLATQHTEDLSRKVRLRGPKCHSM